MSRRHVMFLYTLAGANIYAMIINVSHVFFEADARVLTAIVAACNLVGFMFLFILLRMCTITTEQHKSP